VSNVVTYVLCTTSYHAACLLGKVQGGSGGKVNFLGGDIFGHCEKESAYVYVPNSECLPR
jgi:hypothetical protein